MKRLLIASALSIATLTAAHAAPKLWQGDLFVTANSGAACSSQKGVAPGDFYRSVFRKGGLAGNGANDMISLIGARSAMHVLPRTPSFGVLNGATSADEKYIFGSAGFKVYQKAKARAIAATVTDPVDASTTVVVIDMTIADMWDTSGCDVTLFGRLSRRP